MDNRFFERPILNSPYEYPVRHWELDTQGQPTQQIIETRRPAKYITPIPKPKKRKTAAAQADLVFDEGKGISTQEQQYDPTPVINHGRTPRKRRLPWKPTGSPASTATASMAGGPSPSSPMSTGWRLISRQRSKLSSIG